MNKKVSSVAEYIQLIESLDTKQLIKWYTKEGKYSDSNVTNGDYVAMVEVLTDQYTIESMSLATLKSYIEKVKNL
jgi:phage terminase Nu1 subunit (DNA packaging protein)